MSTTGMTDELRLALYAQHSDNFRSLNAQMWQIPVIAMTLTGGLWFGVSSVKGQPLFQILLLGLACVGNVALIFILARIRIVMRAYLDWLNTEMPEGQIVQHGPAFLRKPNFVRTTFQIVLGIAAIFSFGLLVNTALHAWRHPAHASTKFYDGYATDLADEREVPGFDEAHPLLGPELRRSRALAILDIGSGGLRDVPAMAAMGHRVLYAWPAPGFGRLLSSFGQGRWSTVRGAVPDLHEVRGARRFDLIVVNGEWAHVPENQRQVFLDRLLDLLRPGGRLYMAFRDGPADDRSGVHPASVSEVGRLARLDGAHLVRDDVRPDLAGRPNVRWRSVLIAIGEGGAAPTAAVPAQSSTVKRRRPCRCLSSRRARWTQAA